MTIHRKEGHLYLLVERFDGGSLMILHCDGNRHAVLGRAEAWGEEGRVLRAAASVHAEILAVVLLAAVHHQAVEQRGLRHSPVAVTYREERCDPEGEIRFWERCIIVSGL